MKVNQPKLANMCGYNLATNLQNFTEIYSVSRKKRDQNDFFGNIFYKTLAIFIKLVHRFLNKFAAK